MNDFLNLIHEMSPYLLLGFLIAGLMHAFVPGQLYSRYFSARNVRSVLLAALFGIPLPLCSCGVIPTAMSLRRERASRGATTSFLIATPQTGVDSVIATFSLLGLPFAILRPVAALITALIGGTLVNVFDDAADAPDASTSATCDGGCAPDEQRPHSLAGKMKVALRYGFVDMMADIGRRLVIGLLVAGVITVFVPDDFFARFAEHSLLSMAAVLLLAVPMYVCATGSIPIAVALLLKGLSPGTALVLLMAGPAVNVASMLVVGKVLGRRTLVVYTASIVGGAMLFGLAMDAFLPREWFVPTIAPTPECCRPETPLLQWISTLGLGALLINALLVQPLRKRTAAVSHEAHERVFVVRGMSCNHCRTNVERVLRSLEEVDEATVSLERGEAVVKGAASLETLQKAVSTIGFELLPPS